MRDRIKHCLFIMSFALLSLTAAPRSAKAVAFEPNTWHAQAAIGPSIRLGNLLGGSRAYGTVAVQGEYIISEWLTGVGDVTLGFAGTVPLRFHVGSRLRWPGLNLPISPWVQAQFTAGRVFDVLGANLTVLGGRLALGSDYFFTAQLSGGMLLGFDLMSTLGQRPAFYGVVDILFGASYAF